MYTAGWKTGTESFSKLLSKKVKETQLPLVLLKRESKVREE